MYEQSDGNMVIYFLSAYLWFLIILTADMYPSIILIKSYF